MVKSSPSRESIRLEAGEAKIIVDPFNQRIKIIKFPIDGRVEELMEKLQPYIKSHQLGKILYTSPKEHIDQFREQGFIMEAKVDKLLRGKTGYYLSKFMLLERKSSDRIPDEEEALIKAREYLDEDHEHRISSEYTMRDGVPSDAKQMAELYDTVFQTYPTPMNDPDYIKKAMENNVFFKVIEHHGKIVSAASADTDPDNLNAEMTDCATYPQHRGNGLMGKLIDELEQDLRSKNYIVLYTMARAISKGMNIVFAKHNYEYAGRLINNCHICGRFEDMNIWFKTL